MNFELSGVGTGSSYLSKSLFSKYAAFAVQSPQEPNLKMSFLASSTTFWDI